MRVSLLGSVACAVSRVYYGDCVLDKHSFAGFSSTHATLHTHTERERDRELLITTTPDADMHRNTHVPDMIDTACMSVQSSA